MSTRILLHEPRESYLMGEDCTERVSNLGTHCVIDADNDHVEAHYGSIRTHKEPQDLIELVIFSMAFGHVGSSNFAVFAVCRTPPPVIRRHAYFLLDELFPNLSLQLC